MRITVTDTWILIVLLSELKNYCFKNMSKPLLCFFYEFTPGWMRFKNMINLYNMQRYHHFYAVRVISPVA
jgi:hypothetical protein